MVVVVVGGLQVHNHATSWPNLQVRTCKNSIQIEFQVGPECGNIYTFMNIYMNMYEHSYELSYDQQSSST